MKKCMFENKSESQAREEILELVREYCRTYHGGQQDGSGRKEYIPGDRISYAGRVYDEW